MAWPKYEPFSKQSERRAGRRPDRVSCTSQIPPRFRVESLSQPGRMVRVCYSTEESLRESKLDAVLVGEADYTFAEISDGHALKDIKGLMYRKDDEILSTGLRTPIANLDDLPMPAWHLYNIKDYHRMSRLLARRLPIAMAEFSRGCARAAVYRVGDERLLG